MYVLFVILIVGFVVFFYTEKDDSLSYQSIYLIYKRVREYGTWKEKVNREKNTIKWILVVGGLGLWV